MKKRIISLLSTVVIVCIMCTPALANGPIEIEPCYEGVSSVRVNFNISASGKTTSTATVIVLPGYTADVYLDLQQNDGEWENIMTWEDSGSGRIYLNKSYYVESGYEYRAQVTVDIYDDDGSYVETVTVNSGSEWY